MTVERGGVVSRAVVELGRLVAVGAVHYGCAVAAVPLSECGELARVGRLRVGAEARSGVRQIEDILSQQA